MLTSATRSTTRPSCGAARPSATRLCRPRSASTAYTPIATNAMIQPTVSL